MVTRQRTYEAVFSEQARAGIQGLPSNQRIRLRALAESLLRQPRRTGVAIRAQPGVRVASDGGYRVVYEVDDAARVVRISAVAAPLASVVGDRSSVWDLPRFKVLLEQPAGSPVKLTHEEAKAIATEAFGSRPDLPSGVEYVKKMRRYWAGLLNNSR